MLNLDWISAKLAQLGTLKRDIMHAPYSAAKWIIFLA